MDAILGLVGALIGAAAALGGTYVSGRRETDDARNEAVRLAAAEHARTLGLASHSIEWLVWKAKFSPSEFSSENIALYEEEIHATLGQLVGNLAVVAAMDLAIYRKFQSLTDELYAIDGEIGKIVAGFAEDPQGAVAELSSWADTHSPFTRN